MKKSQSDRDRDRRVEGDRGKQVHLMFVRDNRELEKVRRTETDDELSFSPPDEADDLKAAGFMCSGIAGCSNAKPRR